MKVLATIEEVNESEALLQEPEEGSQEESDEPSPHGWILSSVILILWLNMLGLLFIIMIII